ncbi:MAG: TIGR03790 family protein [Armatimonadota bacterium]
MKSIIIALCAFLLVLSGLAGCNAAGPDDVLVVCNSNSPVSMRIAAYYMSKRGISDSRLVTVKTVDSSASAANESISPDDYIEQIHKPIADYLAKHSLVNKIKYIVLTKGIPFRLSGDPTGGTSGGLSVDSVLTTLGMSNPISVNLGDKGHPVVNRYWRSKEPFSHQKYGGYLVTRLDGYTEGDAKALVDRAIAPAPEQRVILLDADAKKGLGDAAVQPKSILNDSGTGVNDVPVSFPDFNADMIHLSNMLPDKSNTQVVLDKTDSFICISKPLTVYVSWGSNDGKFNTDVYHNIKFGPRSLAETAVSSSGRTLLKTTGGQSLIADLIAQGTAGAKGYVTEPYLVSMASPSVFIDLYLSGRNLAESFYAGSRFLAWKDIVLGDPLCSLAEK